MSGAANDTCQSDLLCQDEILFRFVVAAISKSSEAVPLGNWAVGGPEAVSSSDCTPPSDTGGGGDTPVSCELRL